MAIDTAEKRRSVAVLGLPYMGPGVTPLVTLDAEWRQEVAYSYPGIPAGLPPVFGLPVGNPTHSRLVNDGRTDATLLLSDNDAILVLTAS